MRAAVFCLLLALSAPALSADTYAFGSRVLVTGDGAGKVIEVAGKPDRITNIENKLGAVYGERWDYYIGGKTVSLFLYDGIVKRIVETR